MAILLALGTAISVTESEVWLGIWFILFIYFSLPVLILSIADLIRIRRGVDDRHSIFSTGIHITAVFGFLVGLLLYKMAVWSEHPSVDRHAYLPLLFVALVYGFPLVMWIRTRAVTIFFQTINTEETLEETHRKDAHKDIDRGK